jgi:tripartite-type tricarboxylate transporter receptor subunit TctC
MRSIVAALALVCITGTAAGQQYPSRPVHAVAKINSDLNLLLKDAAIRELLGRQGMTPVGGPPERLGELVKRELARWTRVVNAAGIKAD